MKPLVLGFALGTAIAVLARRRKDVFVPIAPLREASPFAGVAEETAPVELERLTKGELYRRAQAAGIPGRSEMSKDQLIAALRAAGI